MFKVGDTVRLKYQGNYNGLWDGDRIVEKTLAGNSVWLLTDTGVLGSFAFDDLKLVTKSDPTDEELAKELRSLADRRSEVIKQLKSRGWNVVFSANSHFHISKTVTETL